MDPDENESGAFDYEQRMWEEEHDPEYLDWLDLIDSTRDELHTLENYDADGKRHDPIKVSEEGRFS